MGDRYWLSVICPKCAYGEEHIYFAPTCGFSTWECSKCGHMVDLEKFAGISYEDASNLTEIEEAIAAIDSSESVDKAK